MLRQLVSHATRRLLLRGSQESVLQMKRAALISALLLAASPAAMAMNLNSPAFQQNGHIPSKYTCEGEDISPPLAWEGVPDGAKSIVLIIDDPDAPDPKAPKIVWVHWVVYNMPPNTKSLPENAGKAGLPQGTLVGLNDFKKTGYGGPCPPIGRHRYFHKLYALDTTLDLRGATKSQIERAMQGHILAMQSSSARFKRVTGSHLLLNGHRYVRRRIDDAGQDYRHCRR